MIICVWTIRNFKCKFCSTVLWKVVERKLQETYKDRFKVQLLISRYTIINYVQKIIQDDNNRCQDKISNK